MRAPIRHRLGVPVYGEHGWSYHEAEAWVRETAATLLLRDGVG